MFAASDCTLLGISISDHHPRLSIWRPGRILMRLSWWAILGLGLSWAWTPSPHLSTIGRLIPSRTCPQSCRQRRGRDSRTSRNTCIWLTTAVPPSIEDRIWELLPFPRSTPSSVRPDLHRKGQWKPSSTWWAPRTCFGRGMRYIPTTGIPPQHFSISCQVECSWHGAGQIINKKRHYPEAKEYSITVMKKDVMVRREEAVQDLLQRWVLLEVKSILQTGRTAKSVATRNVLLLIPPFPILRSRGVVGGVAAGDFRPLSLESMEVSWAEM